jgi:hypothetical protein
MSLTYQKDWVEFMSVRTHPGVADGRFLANYRPTGNIFSADLNSLEYWLTGRYCLYAYQQKMSAVAWTLDQVANSPILNSG